MVKVEKNGDAKIIFEFTGQGEHLSLIQNALISGIECIGSRKEHSGFEEH